MSTVGRIVDRPGSGVGVVMKTLGAWRSVVSAGMHDASGPNAVLRTARRAFAEVTSAVAQSKVPHATPFDVPMARVTGPGRSPSSSPPPLTSKVPFLTLIDTFLTPKR